MTTGPGRFAGWIEEGSLGPCNRGSARGGAGRTEVAGRSWSRFNGAAQTPLTGRTPGQVCGDSAAVQVPARERPEGEPCRGRSPVCGLAPSGCGAPAGPPFLSPGPPLGIPSRRSGGPAPMPGDPVRPGVTPRVGGAESPECCPSCLSGDPEGCRGLCPRVAPSGLRATSGPAAVTALRRRLGSPPHPRVSRSRSRASVAVP
ncbi:hypothetical protein H8959_000047 [Pygathrix nigripes]